MKLVAAFILSLLVTGCAAWHKQTPASNFDAAPARLSDVKSEASSISEELNTTTTEFSGEVDDFDALIAQGRQIAPALNDLWNKFTSVAARERASAAKYQAAQQRQAVLIAKVASVQAQVDAQGKLLQDKDAQIAKLTAADRPNTKAYLAWGLFIFVLGVGAYMKFDKQAGLTGMACGGVYIAAGIFLPSIIEDARYAILGLYVLGGCVVVFFVYRAVRTKIALKQTIKPVSQVLETAPEAEAAWMKSLLSQSQDDTTKAIVSAAKDKVVTPQVIADAKLQKAAMSQLPTTVAPPSS